MRFAVLYWMLAFAVFFSPTAALGEKVRASFPALSPAMAHLWIAKDMGFFEKEGLDVDLVYIRSGGINLAALLSEQIDITAIGGSTILSAMEKKTDIRVLVSPFKKLYFLFLTSPEIEKPADLIGKRIGMTRVGGLTDFGLRYLLEKWKIPLREVQMIQLGGIVELVAAIRTRQIDATILVDPFSFRAMEYGFKGFFDFSSVNIGFPMNAVVTRTEVVRDRPATVERFVKALVQAVRFMKSERAGTMKVVKKYTQIQDHRLLEKSYARTVETFLETDPTPDIKVFQSGARFMGKNEDQIRSMDISTYLTPEFAKAAMNPNPRKR